MVNETLTFNDSDEKLFKSSTVFYKWWKKEDKLDKLFVKLAEKNSK